MTSKPKTNAATKMVQLNHLRAAWRVLCDSLGAPLSARCSPGAYGAERTAMTTAKWVVSDALDRAIARHSSDVGPHRFRLSLTNAEWGALGHAVEHVRPKVRMSMVRAIKELRAIVSDAYTAGLR